MGVKVMRQPQTDEAGARGWQLLFASARGRTVDVYCWRRWRFGRSRRRQQHEAPRAFGAHVGPFEVQVRGRSRAWCY